MSATTARGQGDSPSMFEAVVQYSAAPRWLAYSGLPQALGATRWSVFRAIVEFDHQTWVLKTRRAGKDGCLFRVPQRDLWTSTGLTERTVRRAITDLRETALLTHYRPGGGRQEGVGGSWCTFGVGVETLTHLFEYVAPLLMRIHGGVRGVPRSQLPPGGLQIYGIGAAGVCASPERLFAIWSKHQKEHPDLSELQEVDVRRVTEICDL